jgi:hypothetical protein
MNEKTDNSDKIPEFFLEREKKIELNDKPDRTDNNSEKKKPDGKTTGFDIRFKVTIIVIAIIGFSASAYIFSSEPFSELTDNVSANVLDKSQFIDQIDQCLQKQTVGDITLNSFTQKWAFDFKEKVSKAETNQELESIMNEFYTIVSHCKP